jgi:[ribosomal protein S5]-alanine N-acetyltransferase
MGGTMIEQIETPRLSIRDVLLFDGEAFYRYMNREDYWRNLPMQPPTVDWVRSLVERCLREQTETPRTQYFLAAVSKETGEVIGEAILRIESLWHGQAEIGWGVDAQYTGFGFGTEIGQAILRFGFGLGLYRLYAQCRVGNIPSLRVMAKLAMKEEGVARENVKARGEWWSSSQWSILSTDFK